MARLYELNGVKKPLTEWCREYEIGRGAVSDRLHRGIPLYEALTTPVQEKCKRKEGRTMEDMWKVCNKCQWSELVDHHPACCYIDYPDHGRRPVSAEVCTAKEQGSVYTPRRKGRWTPAQQLAFRERNHRNE